MKLEGKIALVTGGARGIGRAIAERYVAEGATVAIADRLFDEARAVAAPFGDRAYAIELDAANLDSIRQMVDTVVERSGRIDILVNNAAVLDMSPLLDAAPESFDTIYGINVRGFFFVMQAVARHMVARGGGGKIVNMASQAGRRGELTAPLYSSSKAAVISLTQSAGLALIQYGINVNAIAPGVVDTPMIEKFDALSAERFGAAPGETKRKLVESIPARRIGRPEDHAGTAVLLASADADYVVAQTWNVDGGNWMS